jgi:hypothetical protein
MRSGPAALQGSVRLGRSGFALAPTAHSAHIWPPCKRKGGVRIDYTPLRLLIRAAKRRIHPERYAQFF